MSGNYARAQEAIKAKNGGELPSDLYTQTNAELGKILYGMTGEIKHMTRPASKEALVKRIQKLKKKAAPPPPPGGAVGKKRKMGDNDHNDEELTIVKPVKVPRNCLAALSHTQVAQMRRVLGLTDFQVLCMKHDKDLRPLWRSIGMTAQYPNMTGKEKVMERLKTFAQNNLEFHGHIQMPKVVC